MPRLQDRYDMGARPVAKIGTAVPTYDTARGGEAEGLALSQIGKEIQVIAEREGIRLDDTRATDAYNQMQQRALEFSDGENGFTRQKGTGVFDKPIEKDYMAMFDGAAGEIEGGLSNQRQRDAFKAKVGALGLRYNASIKKHVTTETDAYHDKVAKDSIKIATDKARLNYNNPTAIAEAQTEIFTLLDKETERKGWSGKTLKQAKADTVSNLHANVIDMAMTSDPAYAIKYYNDNKKEITGEVAERLAGTVEQEAREMMAVKGGEELGLLGSLAEINDALDRIPDRKLREATKKHAYAKYSAEEAEEDERKKQLKESVLEDMFANTEIPGEKLRLPPRPDEMSVLDYTTDIVSAYTAAISANRKAIERTPENMVLYDELFQLMLDDSRIDEAKSYPLIEKYPQLSDAQFKYLRKEQAKLKAGHTNASKYMPKLVNAWHLTGGKAKHLQRADMIRKHQFISTLARRIQQVEDKTGIAPETTIDKIIHDFVVYRKENYVGASNIRNLKNEDKLNTLSRAYYLTDVDAGAKSLADGLLGMDEYSTDIDIAIELYNRNAPLYGKPRLDVENFNHRALLWAKTINENREDPQKALRQTPVTAGGPSNFSGAGGFGATNFNHYGRLQDWYYTYQDAD